MSTVLVLNSSATGDASVSKLLVQDAVAELRRQDPDLNVLTRDLGDYAESERLHRRALAIAERALGPSHPDVAAILNSLARLHVRQERLDEAGALLERALMICRAAYGDEHAETATTRLRAISVPSRRSATTSSRTSTTPSGTRNRRGVSGGRAYSPRTRASPGYCGSAAVPVREPVARRT